MENLNQELFRPILKNEICNWLRSVHRNFEIRLESYYASKPYEDKFIHEFVIQGLAKEWIKYSDAFIELIRLGHIDASVCILRSLYEITLQIIYILNNDTEKKCLYYHICFYVKNYLLQHRIIEQIADRQPEKEKYTNVLYAIKQQLSLHKNETVRAKFDELCDDYDSRKLTSIAETDWYSVYYSKENNLNQIKKKSFKWMTDEIAKFNIPILFNLNYSYYALMSRISHGGMALWNHEQILGSSKLRSNNDLSLVAGNIDFYIKMLLPIYEYYSASCIDFASITDSEKKEMQDKLNELVAFCKEHGIIRV